MHNVFRLKVLKNGFSLRKLSNNFFKNISKHNELKNAKYKNSFSFGTVTKIGISISGATLVNLYLNNNAFCEAKANRMAGYKREIERNTNFDWNRFWLYLKPHIWYFIAAVFVSNVKLL